MRAFSLLFGIVTAGFVANGLAAPTKMAQVESREVAVAKRSFGVGDALGMVTSLVTSAEGAQSVIDEALSGISIMSSDAEKTIAKSKILEELVSLTGSMTGAMYTVTQDASGMYEEGTGDVKALLDAIIKLVTVVEGICFSIIKSLNLPELISAVLDLLKALLSFVELLKKVVVELLPFIGALGSLVSGLGSILTTVGGILSGIGGYKPY